MERKDFRVVIFDWDGTLVNSYHEGLRRLEIICVINGISFKEKKERLMKNWGLPGEELLQEGLEIDTETAKRLYRQWELWDEHEDIPLISQTKELLMGNHAAGIYNALLTSRRQPHKVLERYKLLFLFQSSFVYGLDNIQYKKPDPRVFDEILKDLEIHGLWRDQILFVGDTLVDAKCGVGAGIETAIVLTGGAQREDLIHEGIPRENVLNSVAEIPKRFGITNAFF